MSFIRLALKTIRLSIMRIGAGWMFALLTFNFNRIAIYELGAVAVIVTTLIGLHHFISPFQVVWGRLADRYPCFGYRRGPYIVLSSLVGGLVFMALPSLAIGLGSGSFLAILTAFMLMTIFGLAMAANGTSSNALIAETTNARERGTVVAVVWTVLILSTIASAQIAKIIMPEYDPQSAQFLYNLTPFIAVGSALLGWVGLERRISREEHAAILAQPRVEASDTDNAFRVAWGLLQSNRQVRGFFLFVLLAIMGIFLQDAILEVFGAEVFGMTVKETTSFQQVWGGAVLMSTLLVGTISGLLPISKKALATLGGLAIGLGLVLIALAAATYQRSLITPGLLVMGLGNGTFNVGALSMTMDMTVEGFVGLYMGMWGMAQGLGNGLANVLSGVLHTALIETGLLVPATAYGLIFGLEALVMFLAVIVLRGISVQEFKGLSRADVHTAMALDTAV